MRLLAWGLGGAFAAYYAAVGLALHRAFDTSAYDLGINVQTVWLYAHGGPLWNTVMDRAVLGDHFSPTMALWAPLSGLVPVHLLLIAGQAAALGMCAPAAYAAASQLTGSRRIGLLLAAHALLLPWVGAAARSEFHEISLAMPLAFWCLRFAISGLPTASFACLVAMLGVKEDCPLLGLALGLSVATRLARPRLGFAMAGASVLYGLLVHLVLMPAARAGAAHPYLHGGIYYGWLLGDPVGMVEPPGGVGDRVAPLLALLLATAGIPWAGGWILVAPAGAVAYTMMSAHRLQYTLQGHYALPVLAGLLPAVWLGFARTRAWLVSRGLSHAAAQRAMAGVLAAAPAVATALFAPGLYNLARCRSSADSLAARRAVLHVPADAAVSADNHLVPHLAERRRIYRVPPLRDADWVVADLRPSNEPWDRRRRAEAAAALRGPGWMRVAREGPFEVFRRREAGTP